LLNNVYMNTITIKSRTKSIFYNKYTFPLITFFVLTIFPFFVSADSHPSPILLENPLGPNTTTVTQFFDKIVTIVSEKVAPPIIILALVYAGFLYVTARGNPEKIKDAKRAFTWVVIGAAIILGARILSTVVKTTIESVGRGT